MRWIAALVVLVAGCMAAPSPAPEPQDAMVEETLRTAGIDADVAVSAPAGCPPPPAAQVCFGSSPPHTLFEGTDNGSVLALRLRIGPQGYLGLGNPLADPVHWTVACRGEDDRCRRPLAEGEHVLPHDLVLEGLGLPAGTALELTLEATARAIGVDFALQYLRTAHVNGTVTIREQLGLVVPERAVLVSEDGHTGTCIPEVEDCYDLTGGSWFEFLDVGQVRGANLTMAWASTGPLDRELALWLSPAECGATCPEPVIVRGPSPLELVAAGLRYDGALLRVYNGGTETAAGTVPAVGGTRTPVHIEGTLTVLAGD